MDWPSTNGMHTKMLSFGKRIPLVASIAFHTRRKKLSITEQAVKIAKATEPACKDVLKYID